MTRYTVKQYACVLQVFLNGSPEAEEHGAAYRHYYGTYSAAWYLGQALGDGVYATRDRDAARLYFVDDYW